MWRLKKSSTACLLWIFLACAVYAADIDFHFTSPVMPAPPVISEVMNNPIGLRASSFSVSARIEAQAQRRAACDVIPQSDCESPDWYFQNDPGVAPNPPQITLARVYFYYEGDTLDGGFMPMAYSAATQLWTANIPVKSSLSAGS